MAEQPMSLKKKIGVVIVITVLAFAVREGVRAMIPSLGTLGEKKFDWKSSPFAKAEEAVGNTVEDSYTFTDQDGGSFNVADWLDKPLVVSYIYTSCGDVCPSVTLALSRIIKKAPERFGSDYRIVTIGFDNSRDTVENMKKFSQNFISDYSNWKFLVGDKETTARFAKDLGIIYRPAAGGIWEHTVGVTLVAGKKVFAQIFGPAPTSPDIFKPLNTALESLEKRKTNNDTGLAEQPEAAGKPVDADPS
jgi:protein SCO1/2